MGFQLAKKIAYYLFGTVMIYGLGFLLVPVMLAKLGLLEFGLYSTLAIFSISGYIALIEFGLQTSSVKHIAQYFQEGDTNEVNKTLNTVLVIYVFLGALVAVSGYFAAEWITSVISVPAPYAADFVFLLKVTFFTFLFSFPTLGFTAVLKGLQKFVLVKKLEVAVSALKTAGIIILLVVGFRLKEVVLFASLTEAIQLALFAYFTLKSETFLRLRPAFFSWAALLRLLPLGRLLFIGQICSFAFQHADRLMISLIMGPQALAAYEVVMRIPNALKSFGGQINSLLIPVSSHLAGTHDSSRSLKDVFFKTIRFQIVITFPAIFAAAVFSQEILHVWLGAEYRHLYLILMLALIWNIMSPYFNVGSSILLGLNRRVRDLVGLSVVSAAANLTLNFLLIRTWGLAGIVAATLIALLIVLPLNLKIFGQVLQLPQRTLALDFVKISLMGAVCAALFKIALIALDLQIDTAFGLIAVLALWFVVYYVMIVRWLLDGEDRELLLRLLRKKVGS